MDKRKAEEIARRHAVWGSKIVIATQNIFILRLCERGGATRIDLGGWSEGLTDPFEQLEWKP